MSYEIKQGDALAVLKTMPDESVQCCITSPPYFGLRDYGVEGQIGLEPTPNDFVNALIAVFEEVKRVLKPDGTCWVNLGDSYASFRDAKCVPNSFDGNQRSMPVAGAKNRSASTFAGTAIKHKDLCGIPWRVAFALQEAGWWLRQDIIWAKPNPMPESVTDRCTKAHEYIFLLTKSERYHFDNEAIAEQAVTGWNDSVFHTGKTAKHQLDRSSTKPRSAGVQHKQFALGQHLGGYLGSNDPYEKRNKRSVWNVSTQSFPEAHFATFPEKLVEPMILAGSRPGDTVLDPFNGAGTTGLVALKHGRQYIGIELNPAYIEISKRRLSEVQVKLF